MNNNENKNEKMLILGIDTTTKYVLEYAKSLGVKTIITDYSPVESSKIKQLADEAWQIDVKDIDKIEEKCKEENVTAVFAGNHEFCLNVCKQIAKDLNLSFYSSDKAWEYAGNKDKFKEACILNGLDVPKTYDINNIKDIHYPVMVKPTDGSASRGISICNNESELNDAYNLALNYSPTKKVTIEDYIVGDEYAISYFYEEGQMKLFNIYKNYTMMINGKRKFTFIFNQNSEYDEYYKNIDPKVKKMLDYIECNNAFVFLQAIRKDGKWYFIEMNYRLSGVSAHRAEKSLYGHSLVEKAVSTALNRPYYFNLPETTTIPKDTNMGVYFVYANPGIVKEIKGVEELKEADGIQITLSRFKVGDEVKRTDNMLQMAFYIVVWSNSVEETKNRLDKINNTLHITDVNDNEMLIKFKDFDLFDE